MSPDDIIKLVETLKKSGVRHFKHGDLELDFSDQPREIETLTMLPPKHYEPTSLEKPPSIPEHEPPHIVHQMRSLFKTSDEELVDQLFPLPKQDEEIN